MNTIQRHDPNWIIKIILFWSNWLLVLFLGKRTIGFPGDDLNYFLMNIGTFVVSLIFTIIMLHFLHEKIIKRAIGLIWIVSLLLAVT